MASELRVGSPAVPLAQDSSESLRRANFFCEAQAEMRQQFVLAIANAG
jgi:hypothetical protein